MSRWTNVDVAKGIAIVALAFGIATLWLVADPHFEGFYGGYRPASAPRFWARFASTVTPPTFFALSGLVIGKRFADLGTPRQRSAWAQHLLARGVFLLLLELLITQLYNATHPGADYVLIFEVLSAFGGSFVVLAIGHRASSKVAVVVAATLWLLPELLVSADVQPPDSAAGFAASAWLFAVDHPAWQVEYPIASWLPFVLLGSVAGRRFATAGLPSVPTLLRVAAGGALVFAVLRATTTFGTLGQAPPATVQQFLSPTKYPVSLQFAVLGSSGAALTLAVGTVVAARGGVVCRTLTTLGRQPLLAFVLIKVLVALIEVVFAVRERSGTLVGAAVAAAACIAVLVPTLAAYDRLKRRHRGRSILLRLL
ncbi:MAG: hypothetical protein AAF721_11210 [Myxococcota bacterium]